MVRLRKQLADGMPVLINAAEPLLGWPRWAIEAPKEPEDLAKQS